MKTLKKTTSNLFYRNRYDSGLTQKEMADKCKLSQRHYKRLESGKKLPTLRTFIDISIACSIDINDFVDELKREGYPSGKNRTATKISYATEAERLVTDDGKPYTAYSVVIKHDNTIIRRISDVFLDEESAMRFIDMCNRLELDPQHVDDAIEDALIM